MVLAISAFTEIYAPILLISGPKHSSGTVREKQSIHVLIKVGSARSPVLNILHIEKASRAAKSHPQLLIAEHTQYANGKSAAFTPPMYCQTF